MDNKAKDHKSIAMRVSVVSMIINTILSIGKVAAGIIAGSGAMISDGVHSASDVFSTIIVIIGFNIAHKESDEKHQYGHERFECIAAIILAAILLATGIGIGLSGINKIIAGIEGNLAAPGSLALIAAVISIVVKEWMYWYTRAAAIKINSGALKADAWHHRSDAFSSIAAFVGIGGAMLGFKILDPIASIIVAIVVVKVGANILKSACNELMDSSISKQDICEIESLVDKDDEIYGIKDFKSRKYGSVAYIDMSIFIDKSKSLEEAHEIVDNLEKNIIANLSYIKEINIHAEPYNREKAMDNR